MSTAVGRRGHVQVRGRHLCSVKPLTGATVPPAYRLRRSLRPVRAAWPVGYRRIADRVSAGGRAGLELQHHRMRARASRGMRACAEAEEVRDGERVVMVAVVAMRGVPRRRSTAHGSVPRRKQSPVGFDPRWQRVRHDQSGKRDDRQERARSGEGASRHVCSDGYILTHQAANPSINQSKALKANSKRPKRPVGG